MKKMTKEEYFKYPAFSSSLLKAAAKSPAHTRVFKSETTSMRTGSYIHEAVLEPDLWAKKITIDVASKVKKEWKDAHKEHGENLIKLSEHEEVCVIRDSIINDEIAGHYFNGSGLNEHVCLADDPFSGQRCKALFDRITDDSVIVDFKTCQNIEPHRFERAVVDYGYHVQAAWYLDVAKWAGVKADRFVFVCVETAAPYSMAVYELGTNELNSGRVLYRRGIKNILEARETKNYWKPKTKESTLLFRDWNLEPEEELEQWEKTYGDTVVF